MDDTNMINELNDRNTALVKTLDKPCHLMAFFSFLLLSTWVLYIVSKLYININVQDTVLYTVYTTIVVVAFRPLRDGKNFKVEAR